MTVLVKPSLPGLVASILPYDGLHQTNLYYMLCGVTSPPQDVFDTTPATTHPGTWDDIRAAGLQIPGGGGYDPIYTYYSMGTGVVNFDAATHVLEIGLPAGPTWTGADLFTVDYRYIVVGASVETSPAQPYQVTTVAVIDTGTLTSLSAAPLSITFAVSVTFPGTYPIARWAA